MLRRIVTALVLAIFGLFFTSGLASAAPTPYPPPISVTVIVNINIVIIINGQGVVIFSGAGFLPGEAINVTVNYAAPSGLRSNKALELASAAASGLTTAADSSGAFSTPVALTQAGTATLTATGATSGRTSSLTVQALAAGQTTSAGTTTVAGSTATGTSTVAAVAGDGSGDGTGLAFTGTSIAGPLTIGASALIAGLALLFFGTRLAIRRKHPSAH